MGSWLKIVLALFRAAFPVPTNWADADAVRLWLAGLTGPVADLIVALADNLKLRGIETESAVLDEFETAGKELMAAGEISAIDWAKWMTFFATYILPIIVAFLKSKPAPIPTPPPAPEI